MKKIVIFFIIYLYSCSCTKSKTLIEEPYIISVENKKLKLARWKNSITPPPFFNNFYGANHLIISQNQQMFFYQNSGYDYDMGCFPREEPIPRFMNLQCEKLVEITNVGLHHFFADNVVKNVPNKKHLIISSQNDTIKNQNLLNYLKKSNIHLQFFRRTTMEEDTVLSYKISRDPYYSDNIKWDLKRIYFRKILQY